MERESERVRENNGTVGGRKSSGKKVMSGMEIYAII